MKRPPRFAFVALGLLSAASAAHAQEASAGRLVVIGGALQPDNAEVFAAVLSRRSGEGPLCVVPTASSDARSAMEGMVERIAAYGGSGSAVGVLISTDEPDRARDPRVAEELRRCSGFYFTGGSQSRVLNVFLPDGEETVAYEALMARWRDGAVVAGSSAGAAMMSGTMISGGSSAEAVAVGIAGSPDEDGVQLRPGMGFFPEGLVDQHFLARGRIGRLLVAALDPESPRIGFGIDENTALVVDGDAATVVGESGVVVIDARDAVMEEGHLGSNVMAHLAGAGDVVSLETLEVTRGGGKSQVEQRGAVPDVPVDIFDRWILLGELLRLSTHDETALSYDVDGVRLVLEKDEGFSAALQAAAGGPGGTPAGLSMGPIRVSLTPLGEAER